MTDTPFERDLNSTQSFGAIDLTAMPTNAVIGLSAQDQAAIAALPVGTALLIVLQAGGGARFLPDTDKVTVGRHPRADIFLDDVTVSRKHAQFIALPDGGYQVVDNGSLNGTYVNRTCVDQAVLGPGDEVQIGKFRMVYYPGPQGS